MGRGSGKYRHCVTIQRQVTTPTTDSYGEVDLTTDANWETFASAHAEVVPRMATETERNDQVKHDITHIVTMRWFTGVTEEMRIVYDSRLLEIKSLYDVGERRREWRMECKEVR